VLLVLADANLRSGRTGAADRLFQEVAAAGAGEPWQSWAAVGRMWTAMQRGEVARARAMVSASGAEPSDPLLSLVLGVLEAGQGERAEGIQILSSVLARPNVPRAIRLAAEMGLGLAFYWSGDSNEALARFDGLARRPEAGSITDEARYAAARVQLELGQLAEARGALERLAAQPVVGARDRPVPRSLLDLDPRAVRRGSVRLYRDAPLRAPIEMALELFDWDGHLLARQLLASLASAPRTDARRKPTAMRTEQASEAHQGRWNVTPAGGSGRTASPEGSGSTTPTPAAMALPLRALLWGILVLATVAVAFRRRAVKRGVGELVLRQSARRA